MSRSQSDDNGRDGRTQIGKAVILVVVTAAIAVLVLYHLTGSNGTNVASSSTTTTTVPAKTTTTTAPTKPLVAPAQIKLQVLNGLLTGTLAGNLSTTLKASPGYDTLPANNTTTMTSTSVIYVVTTGYYPEAEALAATLGLGDSTITKGIPAGAPVPSGVATQANLIVVIGTSLQAKAGT
ncbi:MAG TPA: LytR C-terminal domain-containing protein [Acidimicrobiales bacterium]